MNSPSVSSTDPFHGTQHGAMHWLMQRVSAIAVAILGLWFIAAIGKLVVVQGFRYLSVVDWLHQPLNAALSLLLALALLFHSQLGWQVVIEDYVRPPARRWLVWGQRIGHVVLAMIAIYAITVLAISE